MRSLTIHGHAQGDALLEAAQLALVAGDLVDDAAAIVLTGVRGVEVLLDGAPEESLTETVRRIKSVFRGRESDRCNRSQTVLPVPHKQVDSKSLFDLLCCKNILSF